MLKIVKKTLSALHKVEETLLVVFVSAMVIITAVQMILRNIPGIRGVEWFDMLVRYLVLWAGMLAAGITTAEGRHIKIDIVGKFTKGRFKEWVTAFTTGFAGFVSLLLSIISVIYIITIEMPSTESPPFLNIPRWILLIIMPIGFFLMSARFFVRSIEYGIKAYKNIEDIEESELDAFPVDEEHSFEKHKSIEEGDE